jgi:hypothetical protein
MSHMVITGYIPFEMVRGHFPPCPGNTRSCSAGNDFNGVEKVITLYRVTDIGVEKECMFQNVYNLRAEDATHLRSLYFIRESFDQVSVDNAIRCCEKCKDVLNEVPLVVV